MTDIPGAPQASLIDRVKAIILRPSEEWPRIAADDTPTRDIFISYILPLAVIGPVAGFIGGQVFGYGAMGFSYKPGLVTAIVTGVIGFVLALVNFMVLALVADFLSPRFGGDTSNERSFKLVAYASTAAWIVGVFALVPMLGVFGLLGLYSIYLFYAGAAPMLNVPRDKLLPYTVVVFLCAIVLNFIVAGLSAAAVGFIGSMGLLGNGMDSSGTLTTPAGEVDTRNLENMARHMEDAANGKAPAVDVAKLQALLPASIGEWKRSATEGARVGALGSSAEGTYENAAGQSITLRIVDMNAMGALAGMGAAMGVEQSREDATGYERTTTVNGRMQTEAWNTESKSGKFGTVIANRFMVEAEGGAESIDVLKAAVATVDPDDLSDLAG
jgi:hypothetical protein